MNLMSGSSIASYYDELIGGVALIFVMYLLVQSKLSKSDTFICLILGMITIIGLVSNIFSQLIDNAFVIAIDVLWLWKTFTCFIAFKYISMKLNREFVIRALLPVAKLTVVFVFLVFIIGEVIDIGVTGSMVFGNIRSFNFFWNNGIQTGWLLFCSVMILSAGELKKSSFRNYLIMSIIPMIMTFSSLVWCWVFIEIALLLMLRKNKLLSKKSIVVLACGVGASAMADIRTYFLSESIRMTMIRYGIRTANTYFPLGSGFATYGSDMASRFYSKLYIQYGWEYAWGLGRYSGQYLNDNFFAGIVGQFGWIGFVLYLLCLVILFNQVNTLNLSKIERISAIATVLTICVVMIGSASAKSMMGVCTFAVLGIICAKSNIKENPGRENNG